MRTYFLSRAINTIVPVLMTNDTFLLSCVYIICKYPGGSDLIVVLINDPRKRGKIRQFSYFVQINIESLLFVILFYYEITRLIYTSISKRTSRISSIQKNREKNRPSISRQFRQIILKLTNCCRPATSQQAPQQPTTYHTHTPPPQTTS